MSAVVTLRDVTRHDLRALLALDAGDGGVQVAPTARSMAQAAVMGEAWPRGIDAGEQPVGFLMLYDPTQVPNPEETGFMPSPLMIDEPPQGRGDGAAAVRQLIEHVRTRPHGGQSLTSIVEPAPQLLAFYGALGFERTDRLDDGERVLRLAS